MKQCPKCSMIKHTVEFSKCQTNKDGLYSYCKKCVSTYSRHHYKSNLKKYKVKHQKNYQLYKEKWKATRKAYYLAHRDHLLQKQIERLQDPDARIMRNKTTAARDNWRRKNDPVYRIRKTIRTRVWNALKGVYKCKHTEELVGCSFAELKSKLESKFQSGMSWDNYGKWHVDHIIPCCSFDLTKESEQKKCFHHSNLQPLWAVDNLRKGDQIV